MAHLLSIIFFFGLLVALAAILELTLQGALGGDRRRLAGRAGRQPAPARPAAAESAAAAGARAAA